MYDIDSEPICDQQGLPDKFYISGMYELHQFELNQSISIANTKYLEAYLTA